MKRHLPLAFLVAGTTTGGLVLGAVVTLAWYVLAPIDAMRTGILIAMAMLAAIAVAWPPTQRWLPERACQVSDSPRVRASMERAAFGWGVRLGMGVCTFLVTSAFYALLALALSQKSPRAAFGICLTYGAARGIAIAAFTLVEARRDATGLTRELALGNLMRLPLLVAIAAGVFTVIT